ncbi:hypothetical protein CVT24_008150 [Panaeolus cyanescens]|uniref:Uncharacterized protein n=1 Tax=Panaeolus cyanescens TaxID=181874 RepID=A0A409W4Q3_9AGAR|nr:hypothetical protein CVT24_008150 [Panaeolus cyanescens]
MTHLFDNYRPENECLLPFIGSNLLFTLDGDTVLVDAMQNASRAPYLVGAKRDLQYTVGLSALFTSEESPQSTVQYHISEPDFSSNQPQKDLKLQIFGEIQPIGTLPYTVLRKDKRPFDPPNVHRYRLNMPSRGGAVMHETFNFQMNVLRTIASSIARLIKAQPVIERGAIPPFDQYDFEIIGDSVESASGLIIAKGNDPDQYMHNMQRYVGNAVGKCSENVNPMALITGSLVIFSMPESPLRMRFVADSIKIVGCTE